MVLFLIVANLRQMFFFVTHEMVVVVVLMLAVTIWSARFTYFCYRGVVEIEPRFGFFIVAVRSVVTVVQRPKMIDHSIEVIYVLGLIFTLLSQILVHVQT